MSTRIQRRKIPIFIALIIIVFIVIIYNLKSPIFRLALSKKINHTEEKYNIKILYSNARLKGFITAEIDNIAIKSKDDSIMLEASKIFVKFDFKDLIFMSYIPRYIGVDSLRFNLNSVPDQTFVVSQKDEIIDTLIAPLTPIISTDIKISPNNFRQFLKALSILSKTTIDINGFVVNYIKTNQLFSMSTERFIINEGNFSSQVKIIENGITQFFTVKGDSNNLNKSKSIIVFSDEKNKVEFPLMNTILGLTCKFDTLLIDITGKSITHDSVYISSTIKMSGLELFHRKLSDSTVNISSISLNFRAGVTENNLILDSTSTISINSLSLPFIFSINTNKSTRATLNIEIDSLDGKSLFESLPHGLFSSLEGIRVAGKAKFEFMIDIDFANLDSLNFNSKLTPKDFKIISFGETDFRLLRDTFTYLIYLEDSIIKSITLAPNNEYYSSLKEISPYIINAVVVAEDGGFYNHNGFDSDGFRYALTQNIKNKKLARGGSTITMQLVKNIYLNRNKTIARKAEEALIVWLIETQNIVEKDRILEIYLNIIDWGPEINGINEAAEFYFNKKPIELELNEAIFLASIIPSPNKFMHGFEKDGNLGSYYEGYFEFVAKTMRERDYISDEELEKLIPNVSITGPAKLFLKQDSTINSTNTFPIKEL
jgi:hypothetical protein